MSIIGYKPIDAVGDSESFPNFWCCGLTPLDPDDHTVWMYEISERRNDAAQFVRVLRSGYFRRFYGFNVLAYDSPVIHKLVDLVDEGIIAPEHGLTLADALKSFSQRVIDAQSTGNKFAYRVHWKDEVVKMVDLLLIHHFDNVSRMTSLKTLEFNMRSRRVQDLPFPHTTILKPWQMDVVRDYCVNDFRETKTFAHHTKQMIDFRDQLGGNKFLNMNDTAIGKSFFIKTLEDRFPGICYNKDRSPRQTWRSTVPLAGVIFPWIAFERPETQAVLDRLKATTLRADEIKARENAVGKDAVVKVETKGVFKDLTATLDGFTFVFGTGGLHGSVSNRIVRADALNEIADVDVEAFYPSIAIENGAYPEHLGPGFVQVYRELKDERVQAKIAGDMVKSDALKLANNGVYGDSNSAWGPFYDPKYTMTITVNGQLMLTMLGEQLQKIPGLEIIQANTDGLTLFFPRAQRARFDAVCGWWQRQTQMKLEEKQYETMWIRDVNSYIARYSQDAINKGDKGKYKRKGAYDFELKVGNQKAWHKDHSSLVIQKAACAALCDDLDPYDFIRNHDDPWDFLMRAKVTGQTRLMLDDGSANGKPCQMTTRFYVAHDGLPMFKIMPPLAKAPDKYRKMGMMVTGQSRIMDGGGRGNYRCLICGDHGPKFKFKKDFEDHNRDMHAYRVRVCDVYEGERLTGLNIDYYLKETEKLLLQ